MNGAVRSCSMPWHSNPPPLSPLGRLIAKRMSKGYPVAIPLVMCLTEYSI